MSRKLQHFLLALLGLWALSSAAAIVEPDWIQTRNFGGQPATVYTSNLADIVFNARGEIVGWYVKVNSGDRKISGQKGQDDFSALRGEKGVTNLVGGGAALVVGLPGAAAPQQAAPVELVRDVAHNRMQAVFRYTQGAATVAKTVVLHPRQFSMQADVTVVGAEGYTVRFDGLGKNAAPGVKSVNTAGQLVEGPAQVKGLQYATLYDVLSHGFLGLGSNSYSAHALIVRPRGGQLLNASTTGGSKAHLTLTGLRDTTRLDIYGGKNELIHLYQEGYTSLPGLFQPNLFGQISLTVVKLMTWLYGFTGNWGLVILMFTVLLRLVIWPLMQAQGRTTAKMQMVQPMLKEMQTQHKDDPQRLQQETMRIYRDYNVNPAGCLSMFIPLPILAVLFSTFRNFEFDQGLWWLPDLSLPDPFYVLAVVYVLANLLQLYISTRKTPQMFKQQSFIYVIYLYFALTFPAGVTLYWIISTLIGAGQQYLINKQVEAHMSGGLQKVERVSPAGAGGVAAAGKTTVISSKPQLSKLQPDKAQAAKPGSGKGQVRLDKSLKPGKPATGTKK